MLRSDDLCGRLAGSCQSFRRSSRSRLVSKGSGARSTKIVDGTSPPGSVGAPTALHPPDQQRGSPRRWGVTIAAVSLVALSQIGYESLTLVPMIGLGIAWDSMIGLPSMTVSTHLPKKQTGVYLGVLNMMIVIPTLAETLTFGWIFKNLLGGQRQPRDAAATGCSAVPGGGAAQALARKGRSGSDEAGQPAEVAGPGWAAPRRADATVPSMATLLHLDSSADLTGSVSRRLTARFAAGWAALGHATVRHDLFLDQPPHLPSSVLHWPPSLRATDESVEPAHDRYQEELVGELLAADVVLVERTRSRTVVRPLR